MRLKTKEYEGNNNNNLSVTLREARQKRKKIFEDIRDKTLGSPKWQLKEGEGAVSDLGGGARAGGPRRVGHSLLQQVQPGGHGREGGLRSHRERRGRTFHL